MKFLIVGLGNPGLKYQNTRHNIGFKVLEELANRNSCVFESGRYAEFCKIKFKSRILILVKPTTFMNLSGKAAHYWLQYLKLDVTRMLVVTDDIALESGELRIRSKGSNGGHNGLKNIENMLNTQNYSRLRFGIGNDFKIGRQSEYVLNSWDTSQNDIFLSSIDQSISIIESFCTQGVVYTMNNYNRK
ncbi:MAG: aminoacyl-tRNA hydrolase [Bacteroidota bacterium]|nr:aminoacyl-tRNA hydrolase [Bacteroidota bacterium]